MNAAKKLRALARFDMANSLRDSIALFMLLMPIVLSVGARLLLPGIESAEPSYAVLASGAGGEALAGRLEAYGNVERLSDMAALEERVSRVDEVAGFYSLPDGGVGMVAEGNESAGYAAQLGSIAAAVAARPAPAVAIERVGGNPFPLREFATALILMLCAMMGGLALSFPMIEEKESGMSRAIAASPANGYLSFAERALASLALYAVAALASYAVMEGFGPATPRVLVALLFGALLPPALALGLGGIAKNQMQAIALLKVLMFVFVGIPVISAIVDPAWRWPFWIFPNYWMLESLRSAISGGTELFLQGLACLGCSAAWIIPLYLLSRKGGS